MLKRKQVRIANTLTTARNLLPSVEVWLHLLLPELEHPTSKIKHLKSFNLVILSATKCCHDVTSSRVHARMDRLRTNWNTWKHIMCPSNIRVYPLSHTLEQIQLKYQESCNVRWIFAIILPTETSYVLNVEIQKTTWEYHRNCDTLKEVDSGLSCWSLCDKAERASFTLTFNTPVLDSSVLFFRSVIESLSVETAFLMSSTSASTVRKKNLDPALWTQPTGEGVQGVVRSAKKIMNTLIRSGLTYRAIEVLRKKNEIVWSQANFHCCSLEKLLEFCCWGRPSFKLKTAVKTQLNYTSVKCAAKQGESHGKDVALTCLGLGNIGDRNGLGLSHSGHSRLNPFINTSPEKNVFQLRRHLALDIFRQVGCGGCQKFGLNSCPSLQISCQSCFKLLCRRNCLAAWKSTSFSPDIAEKSWSL